MQSELITSVLLSFICMRMEEIDEVLKYVLELHVW